MRKRLLDSMSQMVTHYRHIHATMQRGATYAPDQHHANCRRARIACVRSFGGFRGGRKKLIGRYLPPSRGLDPRRQFPRWPVNAAPNAGDCTTINSDTITEAGVIEAVLCHPIR